MNLGQAAATRPTLPSPRESPYSRAEPETFLKLHLSYQVGVGEQLVFPLSQHFLGGAGEASGKGGFVVAGVGWVGLAGFLPLLSSLLPSPAIPARLAAVNSHAGMPSSSSLALFGVP